MPGTMAGAAKLGGRGGRGDMREGAACSACGMKDGSGGRTGKGSFGRGVFWGWDFGGFVGWDLAGEDKDEARRLISLPHDVPASCTSCGHGRGLLRLPNSFYWLGRSSSIYILYIYIRHFLGSVEARKGGSGFSHLPSSTFMCFMRSSTERSFGRARFWKTLLREMMRHISSRDIERPFQASRGLIHGTLQVQACRLLSVYK